MEHHRPPEHIAHTVDNHPKNTNRRMDSARPRGMAHRSRGTYLLWELHSLILGEPSARSTFPPPSRPMPARKRATPPSLEEMRSSAPDDACDLKGAFLP